jgi:hypothetical protein
MWTAGWLLIPARPVAENEPSPNRRGVGGTAVPERQAEARRLLGQSLGEVRSSMATHLPDIGRAHIFAIPHWFRGDRRAGIVNRPVGPVGNSDNWPATRR